VLADVVIAALLAVIAHEVGDSHPARQQLRAYEGVDAECAFSRRHAASLRIGTIAFIHFGD
jgi:Tfp pilus assembly protein FimT